MIVCVCVRVCALYFHGRLSDRVMKRRRKKSWICICNRNGKENFFAPKTDCNLMLLQRLELRKKLTDTNFSNQTWECFVNGDYVGFSSQIQSTAMCLICDQGHIKRASCVVAETWGTCPGMFLVILFVSSKSTLMSAYCEKYHCGTN